MQILITNEIISLLKATIGTFTTSYNIFLFFYLFLPQFLSHLIKCKNWVMFSMTIVENLIQQQITSLLNIRWRESFFSHVPAQTWSSIPPIRRKKGLQIISAAIEQHFQQRIGRINILKITMILISKLQIFSVMLFVRSNWSFLWQDETLNSVGFATIFCITSQVAEMARRFSYFSCFETFPVRENIDIYKQHFCLSAVCGPYNSRYPD